MATIIYGYYDPASGCWQALTEHEAYFDQAMRDIDECIAAIRERRLPKVSPELLALAEEVTARLASRPEPDIDAWAARLAADVADACD